jgi:hypothetical protein
MTITEFKEKINKAEEELIKANFFNSEVVIESNEYLMDCPVENVEIDICIDKFNRNGRIILS